MKQTPAYPGPSKRTCSLGSCQSVPPGAVPPQISLFRCSAWEAAGRAKNSRRSTLPGLYIPGKVINSAFGLPCCSFCKIHVLQAAPSSRAREGRSAPHSIASVVGFHWGRELFRGEPWKDDSVSLSVPLLTYCFAYWRYWLFHKVEDGGSEGVAWPVAPESRGGPVRTHHRLVPASRSQSSSSLAPSSAFQSC